MITNYLRARGFGLASYSAARQESSHCSLRSKPRRLSIVQAYYHPSKTHSVSTGCDYCGRGAEIWFVELVQSEAVAQKRSYIRAALQWQDGQSPTRRSFTGEPTTARKEAFPEPVLGALASRQRVVFRQQGSLAGADASAPKFTVPMHVRCWRWRVPTKLQTSNLQWKGNPHRNFNI